MNYILLFLDQYAATEKEDDQFYSLLEKASPQWIADLNQAIQIIRPQSYTLKKLVFLTAALSTVKDLLPSYSDYYDRVVQTLELRGESSERISSLLRGFTPNVASDPTASKE